MEVKNRKTTLIVQSQAVKAKFGGKTKKYGKRLAWKGKLRPSPLSIEYLIELNYEMGKMPKVFILYPLIDFRKKKIPHTYSDNSLCLYYPLDKEWNPEKLLAKTIIPWTCEWLMHYEIWLITGRWNGGGIDHEK